MTMKKGFSMQLTIWGVTLFVSGAILLSGGITSAGALCMMIGGIIGLLNLIRSNGE